MLSATPVVLDREFDFGEPPAIVVAEPPRRLKTRPPPTVLLDLDEPRWVVPALIEQPDDGSGHGSGCIPTTTHEHVGSLDGVVVVTDPCPARSSVGEPDPVTFTATAAYPYVDCDRATAGLRGQLREIVAKAGAGEPDWSTLAVDGPTETEGLHGRVWFVWTAGVPAV
jgi:hypothetical protein